MTALTVGHLRAMLEELGAADDDLPVVLVIDPTGHERAGHATTYRVDNRTCTLTAEAGS